MRSKREISNVKDTKEYEQRKVSSSSKKDTYQRLAQEREKRSEKIMKAKDTLNIHSHYTSDNKQSIIKYKEKLIKALDKEITEDNAIYEDIREARDILLTSEAPPSFIEVARSLNDLLPSDPEGTQEKDKKKAYIASESEVKETCNTIKRINEIKGLIRANILSVSSNNAKKWENIIPSIEDVISIVEVNKHLGKRGAFEPAIDDLNKVVKFLEDTGTKSQTLTDLENLRDDILKLIPDTRDSQGNLIPRLAENIPPLKNDEGKLIVTKKEKEMLKNLKKQQEKAQKKNDEFDQHQQK